jgi:rare lipoprotein A
MCSLVFLYPFSENTHIKFSGFFYFWRNFWMCLAPEYESIAGGFEVLSHNQKTRKCFEFITLWGFIVVLVVAFNGCGAIHNAQMYEMSKIQFGVASWYANDFHGNKTSNGEKYNKDDFTAAHRMLPFGTIVKVTNVKNGRSAYVRINDRGPHKVSRKVDLSYAAAKKIGMINDGVARIRLEVIDDKAGKVLYKEQEQIWQAENAKTYELSGLSESYDIKKYIPIIQAIGSVNSKIVTLKLKKIPFGVIENQSLNEPEPSMLIASGLSSTR